MSCGCKRPERRRYSTLRTIPVVDGGFSVAPAAANRVRLSISPSGLWFGTAVVAPFVIDNIGAGWVVASEQFYPTHQTFDSDEIGDIVTAAWYGFAADLSPFPPHPMTLAIIETFIE